MDPVSAIGLAGSVVNIVGAVTGMIISLQELRRHWKDTDLTVVLLIAQLTTLKAALNQIAEWISSSLVDIPQYRQLIIDLEESWTSCNVLITFMDHHMAKLAWTETQALTYESRVRVILEGKAIKDCLDHLNNQSNALNLLLTVFNWLDPICHPISFCTCPADSRSSRTHSEQKALLEGEKNRRVFEQIRDDSSSLVVIYDSDSLFSAGTDTEVNSPRLSTKFIFDGELLGSKVYQGTMRSLIRRMMHRGSKAGTESIKSQSTGRSLLSEEKCNTARSNRIDALISKSSKDFERKVDVLVVGLSQSGKSTLLSRMRQLQEPIHHDSYVTCIELWLLNTNEFTALGCLTYLTRTQ